MLSTLAMIPYQPTDTPELLDLTECNCLECMTPTDFVPLD